MSRLLFDSFDVSAPSGGPTLSPPDGSLLNVDPEVARWTPVGAVLSIPPPQVPLIFAVIGSLHWTVYDGSDFTPLFKQRSTAVNASGQWTLSILPNGGWWRSNITIVYASGTILAS